MTPLKTMLDRHGNLFGNGADYYADAKVAHELLAEREEDAAKWKAQLNQQVSDSCETDTAIRELCGHVDDGYTVPLVEVVQGAIGKLAAVREFCQRRMVSEDMAELEKIWEGR